jgi:hypothetical protein
MWSLFPAFLGVVTPARSQSTDYEFNDAHFHLTNNIQEGPSIADFPHQGTSTEFCNRTLREVYERLFGAARRNVRTWEGAHISRASN